MSKRKRREALAKQDIDISIPFRFDIIGSKDDPCFGKLYDMTTSECQRCGDSEFCAIAMMARNKRKRDKIEKTQVFKDTETTDSPEEGRYKRFKEYIIKCFPVTITVRLHLHLPVIVFRLSQRTFYRLKPGQLLVAAASAATA